MLNRPKSQILFYKNISPLVLYNDFTMVRCKCEIDGTILARRPTQKEQTDVLFLVQSIEFPELALKELRTFRH